MIIAGVDEAGRGPLAGPVVSAAVILNPQANLIGLNDSKKLSADKRQSLSNEIKIHSVSWSIGVASVQEIDDINILRAEYVGPKESKYLIKRLLKFQNVKDKFVLINT